MTGSGWPDTPSGCDALLVEVSVTKASMPNIISGMQGWQKFGSMLQSILRGPDENATYSDSLMPDSLGTLLQNHLKGWTGPAADEFTSQVNVIGQFGKAVGMTMYDAEGEDPPYDIPAYASTFHRALSDLYEALELITWQRPQINKSYDDWASALANNIYNYSYGYHDSKRVTDGLPDWQPTTADNPQYYVWTFDPATTSTGTIYFTISDGVESNPLNLEVPGIGIPAQFNVYNSQTSAKAIKDQITSHFTTLYRQRLGALIDLITSTSGTYYQVGHQLPAKIDESSLPKGKPSPTSQNWSNSNGGVPFSGSGFHGSGLGGSGGGNFGVGGGGLPGGPGGLGGGGLPGSPGGLGGGGLPGSGGTTKIAGVGPGGPGGIGSLGGGGVGGSGLGSLGGGLGSGLGGSGSGGLGSAGGAPGALTGAAGSNGAALPLMPPMMPPMMGAGQNDNARQRKSWLPDDEDIWGDEGTAVPPVISSDG